jgi:hypothetical protein
VLSGSGLCDRLIPRPRSLTECAYVCVRVCVSVRVYACVYVCVCVRARAVECDQGQQ